MPNAACWILSDTALFHCESRTMRPIAFDRPASARSSAVAQVYETRRPPANPATLKLLVLMAPGDMTSNTPVDCLLEGADVQIKLLYVLPGRPLPAPLPDHDAIFVAIGISSANQVLLGQLAELPYADGQADHQFPGGDQSLSRATAYRRPLKSVPGALMPATVTVESRAPARRAPRNRVARRHNGRRAIPDHRAPPRFAGREGSCQSRRALPN